MATLNQSSADQPNAIIDGSDDLSKDDRFPKWGPAHNSDTAAQSPWARKIILSLGECNLRPYRAMTSISCAILGAHDNDANHLGQMAAASEATLLCSFWTS